MSLREDIEEEVRAKYGERIYALNEECRRLRREVEEIDKRLGQEQADAEQGRAFQKMIAVTRTNPIVKAAWDRFMMTLRMTDSE